MDELSCCATTFLIAITMQSAMLHDMVSFSRMLSPIGCNAFFCCLRYDVQLQNVASIKKLVVRGYVRYAQSPDVIHTARCLLELLFMLNTDTHL